MTALTLVLKNLTRSPMRSSLTVVAVALPMALFVMTQAITDILGEIAANSARELRLGVHNKVSLTNTMPESLRRQIEDLDPNGQTILTAPAPGEPGREIKVVCAMRWFGGTVPETQFRFPSLCGDPDTLPLLYRNELQLTPAELASWAATKNAAIVGPSTMENFGWVIGQEVELKGTISPYLSLRFKIVAVGRNLPNPTVFYFRRDYLDDSLEAIEKSGQSQTNVNRANLFWIKCRDAEKLAAFAKQIDEHFANTPDETQTEDESTFFANFVKAGGDFPGKLRIVGLSVVLAIVMVVANTMSLTFRERTRELAAIKALGFPNGWIVRQVMAESFALALIGGAVGLVPLIVATNMFSIRFPGFPIQVVLPTKTLIVAGVVTLLIGLVAGLLPAWQVTRLKVTDALRRVG